MWDLLLFLMSFGSLKLAARALGINFARRR
jgi:hypothetical protein